MEKKLTIRELSPYLPYGVMLSYREMSTDSIIKARLHSVSFDGIETTYLRKRKGCVGDVIMFSGRNNLYDLGAKLILHPLSDLHLFKDELRAIKFRTDENGIYSMISDIQAGLAQWDLMTLCFENHIDVFNLIPEGLAIDINTLEK